MGHSEGIVRPVFSPWSKAPRWRSYSDRCGFDPPIVAAYSHRAAPWPPYGVWSP